MRESSDSTRILAQADSPLYHCGNGDIVVGEVYLWGKIVDCQYGYRAQYVYPKRFYSNSYEYNNAYNNSTFALHEFNVPIEPIAREQLRNLNRMNSKPAQGCRCRFCREDAFGTRSSFRGSRFLESGSAAG
jgi:hypothetical protein